jgi:hypothetical protein
METTPGISLCSYVYFKLAKRLFFLSFMLSSISENKRAEQALSQRGMEVTQIMYTHVSKCKNDKIKIKIINNETKTVK